MVAVCSLKKLVTVNGVKLQKSSWVPLGLRLIRIPASPRMIVMLSWIQVTTRRASVVVNIHRKDLFFRLLLCFL